MKPEALSSNHTNIIIDEIHEHIQDMHKEHVHAHAQKDC